MAYDENEAFGISPAMRRAGTSMLTEYERKDTLYKAYMQIVWISAAVDAKAKRITSGGYIIEEVEQGKGNPANHDKLKKLIRYVNPDFDFLQLIRSISTDLDIYGECFLEVLKDGKGEPCELHKVDCQTMTCRFDKHGKVLGYVQTMENTQETVEFEPDEIIRFWYPDPRASMKALSPIERILGPVNTKQHMADWISRFFKNGAKPSFSVELGEDSTIEDAQRYIKFFKENYTGSQNAHVPPVMYGGAKLVTDTKGTIDIDFEKGGVVMREEILSGYQVPPAEVGVIETASLGTGTGESQAKTFQFNACDPTRQLIFEKINYRIVQKGFGIYDWVVNTHYADYRNDKDVTDIQDKNIRNGSSTINEVRHERGKEHYKEGGDTAVIVASRDIVPVERLDDLVEEQREQAAVSLQGAQAAMQPAQSQKAPSPPGSEEQPPGVPPGPPAKKARESLRPAILEEHTGMMVAFFLKPDAFHALAQPGGEKPEDLHITLAFLGDTTDFAGSLDHLKGCIANFADMASPLSGKVSGVGRFNPSASSDGVSPVYASVDVQGLQAFREALVQHLEGEGFTVANDFAYTPHITLAYIEASASMPVESVPPVALDLDTLWLAVGDDRYAFPLSLRKATEAADFGDWQVKDPDIAQTLSELKAKGVKKIRWKAHPGCDHCAPNHGEVRELGKAFPSGGYIPPLHPHCQCDYEIVE